MFKKVSLVAMVSVTLMSFTSISLADKYIVDTKGAHAFIQFRVKHLGYSWLYGRFNNFSGEFTYSPDKPAENKISIDIDTTSLDSNHAERDKHLRSEDFLNTKQFPQASFISTSYKPTGEKTAQLVGDLTLHGVTKPVTIEVEHIGGGKDPWGGYRHGFEGRSVIRPEEFGVNMSRLGPASAEVELMLTIEGIRQ